MGVPGRDRAIIAEAIVFVSIFVESRTSFLVAKRASRHLFEAAPFPKATDVIAAAWISNVCQTMSVASVFPPAESFHGSRAA